MQKVKIESVKVALSRNEIDERTQSAIIEDLAEMESEQPEKKPTVKKQFVIVVSDPEGKLGDADLTGWVVQIPEDASPMDAKERIIKAAYDFNASPKGRRMPVETIGEACEALPSRHQRGQQVWIKTKEPVYVLKTDNKIPNE